MIGKRGSVDGLGEKWLGITYWGSDGLGDWGGVGSVDGWASNLKNNSFR